MPLFLTILWRNTHLADCDKYTYYQRHAVTAHRNAYPFHSLFGIIQLSATYNSAAHFFSNLCSVNTRFSLFLCPSYKCSWTWANVSWEYFCIFSVDIHVWPTRHSRSNGVKSDGTKYIYIYIFNTIHKFRGIRSDQSASSACWMRSVAVGQNWVSRGSRNIILTVGERRTSGMPEG